MKIKTRKGLWVSSSFTEKFGNRDITPAKTVPGFKTIERNMYDKEIKTELGAQECTLEDVAAFLENPPNGCDDGYANIFYVAGFVVGVGWLAGDRLWSVRVWSRDGYRWRAGCRVFSRNYTLDTEREPSDALPFAGREEFEELKVRVAALEAFYERAIELIPSLESPETM